MKACDHAHVVMVDESTWGCQTCGEELDSLDLALLREVQERDAERDEKDHQDDIKFHIWQEGKVA